MTTHHKPKWNWRQSNFYEGFDYLDSRSVKKILDRLGPGDTSEEEVVSDVQCAIRGYFAERHYQSTKPSYSEIKEGLKQLLAKCKRKTTNLQSVMKQVDDQTAAMLESKFGCSWDEFGKAPDREQLVDAAKDLLEHFPIIKGGMRRNYPLYYLIFDLIEIFEKHTGEVAVCYYDDMSKRFLSNCAPFVKDCVKIVGHPISKTGFPQTLKTAIQMRRQNISGR